MKSLRDTALAFLAVAGISMALQLVAWNEERAESLEIQRDNYDGNKHACLKVLAHVHRQEFFDNGRCDGNGDYPQLDFASCAAPIRRDWSTGSKSGVLHNLREKVGSFGVVRALYQVGSGSPQKRSKDCEAESYEKQSPSSVGGSFFLVRLLVFLLCFAGGLIVVLYGRNGLGKAPFSRGYILIGFGVICIFGGGIFLMLG